MTIYTYEPGARNQVVTRRAEKGPMAEGLKIVGEWASVGGGRVFRPVESDDIKALQAGALAWSDLGRLDILPVIEVEDIMKMISDRK